MGKRMTDFLCNGGSMASVISVVGHLPIPLVTMAFLCRKYDISLSADWGEDLMPILFPGGVCSAEGIAML